MLKRIFNNVIIDSKNDTKIARRKHWTDCLLPDGHEVNVLDFWRGPRDTEIK